jgi:hypothetical protein
MMHGLKTIKLPVFVVMCIGLHKTQITFVSRLTFTISKHILSEICVRACSLTQLFVQTELGRTVGSIYFL